MKVKIRAALENFFNKYFKNQHPEAALRYIPVVQAVKRTHLKEAKLLEVGAGSLGITPYLKRKVDAVDVDFSGPQTNLIHKIKGKADDLPFRKNSYDAVISVDMIEHLSPESREKAIYEMLRVSKKLVVIVVPTGTLAQEQDKQLHELWNRTFKDKNKFLEEHVKNGLPKTDEILVSIDRSLRSLGKTAKVISRPNLNLFVRKILMKTWITKNELKYYLYLKGFLLLLPLLKRANFQECYRRVFVIEFESAHQDNHNPL